MGQGRVDQRMVWLLVGFVSLIGSGGANAQPTITLEPAGTAFPTLAAALAAAGSNDRIEIGAGVLVERNIVVTALGFTRVTIRGQGPGNTIIDGEGLDGFFAHLSQFDIVLQDLTIRGYNAGTEQDAVFTNEGVDTTLIDVHFEDINPEGDAPGAAVTAVYIGPTSQTQPRISDSVIAVNGPGPALDADVRLSAFNSLFSAESTAIESGGGVFAVQCTIVGGVTGFSDFGAFHVYQSCVLTDLPTITGSLSNSVIPAAPVNPLFQQDSIIADPLFVDASNGDYRLSAGSPAIDASDMTDYEGEFALTSLFDAGGDFRIADDLLTPNTGSGEQAFLDIGAFEFQPPPQLPCPADINGDGMATPADFTAWLAAFNIGCP